MTLGIVAVGGVDPGVQRSDLGPETRLATATVIAADSGVAHVRRLDLVPTIVVGDLDSIRDADLAWAVDNGAEVRSHPVDKDETDFDLAMQLAVGGGIDEIVVVGVFGGRSDHFLANMGVLASPRFASSSVRAIDATSDVWVIHAPAVAAPDAAPVVLPLAPGTTVSLLAWGGDAVVTTAGMRWNLDRATLAWDASVGVSNEVLAANPTVAVSRGVVLAVVAKSPPAAVAALEVQG